jgi:hypothetical protein
MAYFLCNLFIIQAYDQLNRDFKKLQQECEYIKECLKQREELIEV